MNRARARSVTMGRMLRMCVRLVFALGLVFGSTSPIAADTYVRQSGVDARHYVFRLTLLTDDSNEIQGETTATFRLVADNVREIVLDLASPAKDAKGMTVTAVTSGGRPVAFTHGGNHLRLPLPAGSRAGQDVSFTITYHGAPANGLRLLDNIHGDRTAFSENWFNRARQWLPMIDHPADKATGEFIVTTRADYQVVANGALVEQVDLEGGRRRTHWKESTPISSWLYALGIARFDVRYAEMVRGVPLEYWVFPQDAGKGFALFERDARGAFEFFSDRVGPFVYEKLAHVEAAGMGGGNEHASNIFYGEKGITAGSGPVVHETAHQWFGNAVTESDWNDVWLSEGFATYFTLLYTEFSGGRDAFVDGLRRSRDAVLRFEKSLPDTPVVHRNFNEAGSAPNNPLVYQKGSWTLHMLRDAIGTDAFWRGIRQYYRQHLNGLASTDDLRQIMEHESGQDLAWFFHQWLNRSGVPAIAGTWRYDEAAKQIVVTLTQTQPGDPYRFPLGIGVAQSAAAPPRVHRVNVTGRESTFTVPSDGEPASVTLDPDVWLLADFGTFTKATAASSEPDAATAPDLSRRSQRSQRSLRPE
jgi:aminopeptidase N